MTVYVCKVCKLYIFDETVGDSGNKISPNTLITDFPSSWRCSECGATVEALEQVPENEVSGLKKKYQAHLKGSSKQKSSGVTLVQVRESSREKLKGICSVNKVCDGSPNRLCMGQKYGAPLGLGGAGKGLSFTANVEALDKIKIKQRLVSDHHEPDLSTSIYGTALSLPAMPSSLSGVSASMGGSVSEQDFAKAILQGSLDAGVIGWIGNTSDDGQELTGVQSVKEVGSGIPIFKPQDNERLLELINKAEDSGAVAVGIDLDGVGSTNWERAGKPVYRKSVADLSELAGATDLPFIVKSIMSVDDALDVLDAGVDGIDVSNHGGRILDSTRGVAEVLPEIVKELKGKITITAGGGVRTGFDIFKLIALGANAVLIGRDMVRAALGGGAEGVKLHFEYLKSDLRRAMLLTSCNSIKEISMNSLEQSEKAELDAEDDFVLDDEVD
jgi:isopentenyl diphosphate isomerase/L-lactate dehydrogenase-like FMN-dependent dehydrogenase/rubredoxin